MRKVETSHPTNVSHCIQQLFPQQCSASINDHHFVKVVYMTLRPGTRKQNPYSWHQQACIPSLTECLLRAVLGVLLLAEAEGDVAVLDHVLDLLPHCAWGLANFQS